MNSNQVAILNPSATMRSGTAWKVVYASPCPVRANRFALENRPGGKWTLSVDSWDFCQGGALAENQCGNLPKVADACRFQFSVEQEGQPDFGALKLFLDPLADAIDPALLKVERTAQGRILVDFGRDTALRGISFPSGTDVSGISAALAPPPNSARLASKAFFASSVPCTISVNS